VGAFTLHEEPERGRDLVVATPACVQLRAGVSREFGDAPLDRGVDVLVARGERERAFGELALDPLEGSPHDGRFLVGEKTHPRQPRDVRARPLDVVAGQPAIEREALRELEERVRGRFAEATVPKRHESSGPPCSRAHVSTESPQSRTKPSESWWR